MEHLSEELSQLDQGNIHSLMGSELQITQLLEHLDQAVMEIEKMETRLDVYDELLSNVRDNMGKLGSQYSVILLQNANLKSLCKEVEQLVVGYYCIARNFRMVQNLQFSQIDQTPRK